MTTEKENTDIFNADLLVEKIINDVVFRIYSNRIFYVKFPEFKSVGPDIIQQGYTFLDENGGGLFYNIFHFDSFIDVDPEVRKWAADPKGNTYTLSDAIVIGSASQKMITDYYLRFDKPIKPTAIFDSLEKAINWTINQIK